ERRRGVDAEGGGVRRVGGRGRQVRRDRQREDPAGPRRRRRVPARRGAARRRGRVRWPDRLPVAQGGVPGSGRRAAGAARARRAGALPDPPGRGRHRPGLPRV
ncbi:MAG: Ferredoxin reductase, partial [uncultured Acetobacteraceae bacterium]